MSATQPSQSSPSRSQSRRPLLPWWVWVLGIALGVAAVLLGWATLLGWPLPAAQLGAVAPLFTVIPPPSLTPPIAIVASTADTSTPQPPSPPAGRIGVGGTVAVVGTGADGLRLRDAPSLGGHILMIGLENEVFTVQDGPRESDGYTWWYLVGVFDQSRKGWAVQNYLRTTGH